MKVCIVAEGCYPYVIGGVSGWIQSLIKSFPNTEFMILAIVSNRSISGKFTYELPPNVTQVHELYLQDYDWYHPTKKRNRRKRLKKEEYEQLYHLVFSKKTDWEVLFRLFQDKGVSINDFLMGQDFMNVVTDYYKRYYPNIVYSDYLWTMRSIYLPLLFVMKMDLPRADVYHCVATGYAGVLGSMAKDFFGSKLLISEHGIYTREREEELIKAKWVQGLYKNIWIDQFYKMARLAYDKADVVTSLYEAAKELQIEFGCPASKLIVTPNGVDVEGFSKIPKKNTEDMEYVNIGAILRVTPIKDVKTMIRAFSFAKKKYNKLRLYILGPIDEDEDYAKECFEIVELLEIEDVIFTGRVQIKDYIGRMDLIILTSISEGQPLTILEGFAAKKPAIATDVGNCKGLILGDRDDFGPAGIVTHIMNVEEISNAILQLAKDPELRKRMGETGYRRVNQFHRLELLMKQYEEVYKRFAEELEVEYP